MKPYLSIIAVGRNDNYGGDFLPRFQRFINNQIELWNRYQLPAELIIVEWNPPAGRPKFKDALLWPKKSFGSIKIIEVPNEIHRQFPLSEKIGLFEYAGKNVGVRRSEGTYVLTTNCDLVFPPELIKFFTEKNLKEDQVYRVDRYDFDNVELPPDKNPEEQLALIKAHIVAIHNRYGAAFLPGESFFGLRNARRIATYVKNVLVHFPCQVPYTNAAGDFFLMHRRSWERLQGFPEIGHFNFPDGFCYMALAAGLKQVNLKYPYCIYHQEHARGGIETGRPRSDGAVHKKKYLHMLKTRQPWTPNNQGWGLGDHQLVEHKIV